MRTRPPARYRGWPISSERKGEEFHRIESGHGAFRRGIALPTRPRTSPEDVEATHENGELQVVSRIAGQAPPKHITIQ